jgi:peroxiredoxin
MPPNFSKFQAFKTEAPQAGQDAPDFSAPLLDGGDVTLSELQGKVVVLHFGAIT